MAPALAADTIAFVDVAVVAMDTERVLSHQTILVADGRIVVLGPTSQVMIPSGARRIDGRGRYLMPGLADMHVHLHPAFFNTLGGYDFLAAHDTTLADHWLSLFVANGVTTIRNMDYMADGGRSLRLRARAAAGEFISPRIYTAGPWLGPESDGNRDLQKSILPNSVAALLAAYQTTGYDFVKVRNETPMLFDSVSAVARRLGLPLAGHLIRRPIEKGLAFGGYVSLEHLDGYHSLGPPVRASQIAKIPALIAATKRAGVWNVPHMTLFEIRAAEVTPLTWPELRYVTVRSYRQTVERGAQMNASQIADTTDTVLHVRRQIVKALQDSGAGLLLGSDTPLAPLVPGFAVHHELQALVRAGLTPYQALAMATKNVGAFFQAQQVTTLAETGTIAVGKQANLVLLGGNPLDDVGHAAQPAGVMLGGRWLPRAELDRRLGILPYWKFPGPEIEELVLLRQGITLAVAQERTFAALLEVQRAQWRMLIDSLRTRGQDQAVMLEESGSIRLLLLAARQFGAYRATVLTPAQQQVFDVNARVWRQRYHKYGFSVMIPGVPD